MTINNRTSDTYNEVLPILQRLLRAYHSDNKDDLEFTVYDATTQIEAYVTKQVNEARQEIIDLIDDIKIGKESDNLHVVGAELLKHEISTLKTSNGDE